MPSGIGVFYFNLMKRPKCIYIGCRLKLILFEYKDSGINWKCPRPDEQQTDEQFFSIWKTLDKTRRDILLSYKNIDYVGFDYDEDFPLA